MMPPSPPSPRSAAPFGPESGLPVSVPREVLRRLSRVRGLGAVPHLVAEWALIAGVISLSEAFWHPLLYLFAVVFIATRQHALLVLMHEAAHVRLLADRRWNDAAANVFCCWPILLTVETYREKHLAHHRYLMSEGDPDWVDNRALPEFQVPVRRGRLIWTFVRDVLGLGTWRLLRNLFYFNGAGRPSDSAASQGRAASARWAAYAVAVIVLTLTGSWAGFALYWVVPMVTWLKWVLYLRSAAEHSALSDDTEDLVRQSRTVLASWWERWLLAPKNVHYHAEHHLFPSVPFDRLPELHRLLMSDSTYRERIPVVRGYWGVLRALSCRSGDAAAPEGA